MSDRLIISIAVSGVGLLLLIILLNHFADILKDNPQPSWFVLGFGSCLFLEGAGWGIVRLLKRFFPNTFN